MRGILFRSGVRGRADFDIVARVHRTTTTATLLVTVAVSALAGCVTVQRPPASGPPAAPRPEPRTVQAPAREALTTTSPSRMARAPKGTRPAPTAPAAAQQPSQRRPAPRADPRPAHSARPRVETPAAPVPAPVKSADVCALGRRYGGWRADSPETAICERTYGH